MITDEKSISVRVARSGLGAKVFIATLCGLVTATMIQTATATDFQSLADEGYRWVSVNGPYATPNKADAAKLAAAPRAATDIGLQDKTHAYFILPGMIVRILENDTSAGLSRVRASGIVVDLWTETRYLSAHPIKDSYGVTETPESSGLANATSSPSPSPSPNGSPSLDANPTLNGSPSPDVSPLPDASPTPSPSPVMQKKHHHAHGQG